MEGSSRKVYVVGVGMTRFAKPNDHLDYPELVAEAVSKAVADAGIPLEEIQQACAGFVYGDSTAGQRALREAGLVGVPVYNVNNNCATGSTALLVAKQVVQSGSDCVLALGFEKMDRGPLSSKFPGRTHPLDRHLAVMADLVGMDNSPIVAQLFGNAGLEYMKKHGVTIEHLGKIAEKNHKHSRNNPHAQSQQGFSLGEILNSRKVFGPLTKLQCSPPSDGAAAAILASEDFVVKHHLQGQAVLIVGMEMCTDLPSTFESGSMMNLVGYDMTRRAAEKLFRGSGYRPTDVDVVELHDCFSVNELISYEALGLCPTGRAGEFVDRGDNTYGGQVVVNPSGGLIAKGHPLGATGVAQCCELCWQLRGTAGKRQVPGARLALQHNIGLGGAVVVALYNIGFQDIPSDEPEDTADANAVSDMRTLFELPYRFRELQSNL